MHKTLATLLLTAAIAGLPSLTHAAALPAVSPATQPAAIPSQADVPVRKVVLFSSGVGYFQHEGIIHNDGILTLHFPTGQINDILKSLVLQDIDGGKVAAVTYPSRDPLSRILKTFQIDLSANPKLADLLNQLRGAKVTLQTAGDTLTGTILGVEYKPQPAPKDDKDILRLPVLNLVTSAGAIRALPLSEARQITLDDPQLQHELAAALTALAQSRDQDKKPVQIHFSGHGDRHVRCGYVIPIPVWKISYRLVLVDQPNDKPLLQGWAIVENQTDADWNNVQLSLVSGRPLSFIEDLYQPLYVPRPVVIPERYANLQPQRDEGGIAKHLNNEQPTALNQRQLAKAKLDLAILKDAKKSSGDVFNAPATAPLGGILNPVDSIAARAAGQNIGELFQYTVDHVSLARRKSAMIPIVADPVQIDRLSIYNPSVLPTHPLNGVRLTNTTDKHLPAGPVTLFDDNSYAGDAQIDNLPPGQHRLLSYGIDLEMLVHAGPANIKETIESGSIVKGVLLLTRKSIRTQAYTADNKSDKKKNLIIEHPLHSNWNLTAPAKPLETTPNRYRFQIAVPAHQTQTLTVQEEKTQNQKIALLPGDIDTLLYYSRTGTISQPVRDALAKAAQLKQALAETERQIDQAQQKITQIRQEQSPIRENMRVINDRNSSLYARYIKKLDAQENQIDELNAQILAFQTQANTQQQDLQTYINHLNFNGSD